MIGAPGQVSAGLSPIEINFGPLAMTLVIGLHRVHRQKCAVCEKRRVCFYVGLGDSLKSPAMCAKCAGIR